MLRVGLNDKRTIASRRFKNALVPINSSKAGCHIGKRNRRRIRLVGNAFASPSSELWLAIIYLLQDIELALRRVGLHPLRQSWIVQCNLTGKNNKGKLNTFLNFLVRRSLDLRMVSQCSHLKKIKTRLFAILKIWVNRPCNVVDLVGVRAKEVIVHLVLLNGRGGSFFFFCYFFLGFWLLFLGRRSRRCYSFLFFGLGFLWCSGFFWSRSFTFATLRLLLLRHFGILVYRNNLIAKVGCRKE